MLGLGLNFSILRYQLLSKMTERKLRGFRQKNARQNRK